jgi:NADH dehydrogenase
MEDAVGVRNGLAGSLEAAASRGVEPGGLTVAIIGGGATGVEMAGALAELRAMQLKTTYRDVDAADARVILVEQRDRLLGPFDEKLSDYTVKARESRGVEVRCDDSVTEVSPGHVALDSGEVIPCSLVIWAAGVGPTRLTAALDLPKVGGRIAVADDLRVSGTENVFAIGDVAAAAAGTPLPQVAQPALQGGKHVAKQIERLLAGRPTEPFVYKDKGIMATIGRHSAVAQFPSGRKLKGNLAWLSWLGLHIFFLLGLRNRVSVLMNWTWHYVSWHKVPGVIAGG